MQRVWHHCFTQCYIQVQQSREIETGVTATANEPGFGRCCLCTQTRARYFIRKICRYFLDVLCARDLKDRQKENMMAHAHAQTPSNKMNKIAHRKGAVIHTSVWLRCSQMVLHILVCVFNYWSPGIWAQNSPVSCYTRPTHRTFSACCHLHHHPTHLTTCCSHTQAGMRPHTHTKARLECQLCWGRQRKHHRVRPQMTRPLHHPPPFYPLMCRNAS